MSPFPETAGSLRLLPSSAAADSPPLAAAAAVAVAAVAARRGGGTAAPRGRVEACCLWGDEMATGIQRRQMSSEKEIGAAAEPAAETHKETNRRRT